MKKKLVMNYSFSIMLIILFPSCQESPIEEDLTTKSAKDIPDAIELGISGLSGISDDLTDETISYQPQNKRPQYFTPFYLWNNAYADPTERRKNICDKRANEVECVGGKRNKVFEACQILESEQLFEGEVSLEFSDSETCNLEQVGHSVKRTFDYTRRTQFGATIRTFSEERTDFQGNKYGGGTTLSKTQKGYELVIHGKHRTRTTSRTKPRVDVSLKTVSPVVIKGGLFRGQRTLSGGEIVLANNLSEYVVSMKPDDLSYTSSCCYPTSGGVSLEFDGNIEGSGYVQFTSCGEAVVIREGESQLIEFDSCD